MPDISLDEAIRILNESAYGVTTFNDNYTEACKKAVRIMVLVKQGKVVIKEIGSGMEK